MRITGALRGECEDGRTCPRVLGAEDRREVLVQGVPVADTSLDADAGVPVHEALVRVPRRLIEGPGAGRLLEPDEFGRWYDEHLNHDLLRVETLDYYDPDAAAFARWRRGESEPDWPARRPWLDRVRAERAAGVLRRRVRVVRGPLTEYVRSNANGATTRSPSTARRSAFWTSPRTRSSWQTSATSRFSTTST